MAIGGFFGVFICFVLFVTAGSRAMMPSGFFTRILVPFLLCIPCGGIGKLGLTITSLGLQIIVTRYTTDSIDETVEYICHNCQETINSAMQFCHRCGTELKKECPKCNHINNHISEYCQKCGTKLD